MSRWSASLWTRHHRMRVISNPNFPARPAVAYGGGWPGGERVGSDQVPRARRLALGYEPAPTSWAENQNGFNS
ncbi:MAG: hypothetical protein HY774_20010 [Acidobacteria bacterium]|nr:hypothetical protein [Acidobacteriota bacterium]